MPALHAVLDEPAVKCVNEKCKRDADRPGAVVVSIDGDFACSPDCKQAWTKQMDHFLTVTINDNEKFNAWLND